MSPYSPPIPCQSVSHRLPKPFLALFSSSHPYLPPPNLFTSRSEADLIGLVGSRHTPPCQGLVWRLLAPGGPELCTARLQLLWLWPADPETLQPYLPQLRCVPYPERGREALSLNSKTRQQAKRGGLSQIKTTGSVCTEFPVTKGLCGCDLAALTGAASPGSL